MQHIILCLFFSLFIGAPLSSHAGNLPDSPAAMTGPIKITVYGKGGLISDGSTHKICSEAAQSICGTIVMDGSDGSRMLNGQLTTAKGERYKIALISKSTPSEEGISGSELQFHLLDKQ